MTMDFGLIVDLETTGLDPKTDKIVEIGLLEFAAESEQNPIITRTYGAIADPEIPLSDVVQSLTRLNDRIVSGQRIDWDIVKKFWQRASLIIAHNAAFDRSFLLEVPEMSHFVQKSHWACSVKHIDWTRHGFKTKNLNYLAADQGFVNPYAHRAVFDCATTFRVVAPFLAELCSSSYERLIEIRAIGAPYDAKDLLKQRGYQWNQIDRVWCKEMLETKLPEEREFLKTSIYQTLDLTHQEVVITWL